MKIHGYIKVSPKRFQKFIDNYKDYRYIELYNSIQKILFYGENDTIIAFIRNVSGQLSEYFIMF